MEQNEMRRCKRCLLQDIAPEEYLEHMKIYLNGLNEDTKAEEPLYLERLSRCRECENLREGICRICGCFVEFRAAVKSKACPAIHPLW